MRSLRSIAPLVLLLACDPVGEGSPSLDRVKPPEGNGGADGVAKGGSTSRGGSGGLPFGKGGADVGKGGSDVGKGGSDVGKGGSDVGKGGTGGSGGTGGTGGTAGAGGKFPLTLTPLSQPQTSTANMSLFFAVTDAQGQPVTDLGAEDFEVREDGAPIAKNESDFQAAPLSGQTLDVPTVLLLDLSGSIVAGGALSKMKQAALAIVKAALPEQRLSLVSFADSSKVRVPFTKDKATLEAAINAITDKDGLSTNLYGAVSNALGQWDDAFVGSGSTGRLTSGFVLVITDGADTAGTQTLQSVIQQRGNKRIITVGVGSEVNVDALKTLGNGGYIASGSFDALVNDVGKINAATAALGKSIYRASYCSPKLAGQHELLFYPKGNPVPSGTGASCNPPAFSGDGFTCDNQGYLPCGYISGKGSCCPPGSPFACGSTGKCYQTAEAAQSACSSGPTCVRCELPFDNDVGLRSGPYLEIDFNANGHDTKQCPAAWGTSCKALASCCASLPDASAQSCASELTQLQGNESQCAQRTKQYCPTLGPQCSVAKTCCDSLTTSQQRESCLAQVTSYAASGNDASCPQLVKQQCPTYGPKCSALKTCCASLPQPEVDQCLQQAKAYAAQSNELACQQRTNEYCGN